jgi:hypothetical protein
MISSSSSPPSSSSSPFLEYLAISTPIFPDLSIRAIWNNNVACVIEQNRVFIENPSIISSLLPRPTSSSPPPPIFSPSSSFLQLDIIYGRILELFKNDEEDELKKSKKKQFKAINIDKLVKLRNNSNIFDTKLILPLIFEDTDIVRILGCWGVKVPSFFLEKIDDVFNKIFLPKRNKVITFFGSDPYKAFKQLIQPSYFKKK